MTDPVPPPTFSPQALKLHHKRCSQSPAHPLLEEIAQRMAERVQDTQKSYKNTLIYGNSGSILKNKLEILGLNSIKIIDSTPKYPNNQPLHSKTGTEEPDSHQYDLIISFLDLHITPKWEQKFAACHEKLSPNGLYLAVLYGNESLYEFKHALAEAEIQLKGGLSPRFAPLPDLLTASHRIEAAGFQNQVADREKISLHTPDIFTLTHELRALGETNALTDRPRTIPPRQLFPTANALYAQNFKQKDGLLHVTLELIYLHGNKGNHQEKISHPRL